MYSILTWFNILYRLFLWNRGLRAHAAVQNVLLTSTDVDEISDEVRVRIAEVTMNSRSHGACEMAVVHRHFF